MKQKKDTRTAILDEAQDLVKRQSLSGVSFQELAKRVGIKKGSIYYHFETKDDLAIELMKRTTEKLQTSFKSGLKFSPRKRLSNFFIYYRRETSLCNKICFGGALAGEWETLSPEVRKSGKEVIAALITGMTDIIKDGVATKTFTTHGRTPDELAVWIISNLQGALVTARILEEPAPYDSMVEIVTASLTPPLEEHGTSG